MIGAHGWDAYSSRMSATSESAAERFLHDSVLHSRSQVLDRPSPVPAQSGVYGWWFRQRPSDLDDSACFHRDGLPLLYTGISPKRPPTNGKPPSTQNLRSRVRTHYTGNAAGSTLRKTLGCLLAEQLGIELRRVGSGQRLTFALGEQELSKWMGENAFVSWLPHDEPWEVEDHLIASLDVPLNLQGNARNVFHTELTSQRAAAVARARSLPTLPNPGVGGR